MFTSYAQNFEDVMLWRALKNVARGFYVDVGAQDPIVDSVSMGFYEEGWRGVHVEPVATYATRLRTLRPDERVVQAALGAEHGSVRFYEVVDTGLSTADPIVAARHRETGRSIREILVPCQTLDEVLAPYADRDVHWMKIDVEGYERPVLQGWISPVRPWIVVIESTAPLTQLDSYREWEDLVLDHGYVFAYFDGLNRFYVRNDREDLRPAFAYGPCVFDRFTLSGTSTSVYTARVSDELRTASDRVEELRRALAAMRTRDSDDERRVREATQLADALQRHIAAMEGTLSWRLTNPLRWLSRQRKKAHDRTRHALQAATGLAVRASASAARRTRLYAYIAPWLRVRYPQLWRRAKLAVVTAARSEAEIPAVTPWEPRTTRDATIVRVADVERRLTAEIEQRRRP